MAQFSNGKTYNTMGLPMNITRGNPIPVDATEIWYSLDEAKNYAANNPTAYVGQSIKVINEITGDVVCYMIGVDGSLLDQVQNNTTPIYTQNEEPIDAENGSLWIDLDAESPSGGVNSGISIDLDTTLTKSGFAADAKVVGDKFIEMQQKINSGIAISDDGYGNITVETITSALSVEDDGDGNIIIS